jgi:ribosome-binding factor A
MAEPNRRHRQIANAIRDELVTIARKDISDPRLERVGMITFSGVELTEDLRNATVWVSFMGKEEKAPDVQAAIEALRSASAFIHRLLIKRIPMKIHPQLSFKFDRSFDRASTIQKALQEAAEVEKETVRVRGDAPAVPEDSENS